MVITEETDRTVYTISIPELVAFRAQCDSEPMCSDWFIVPDVDMETGWVTVRVPNWTADIHEFYAWISKNVSFDKIITKKPQWFEGINPVVAKRAGLTAP
jgi:hypothetical protein